MIYIPSALLILFEVRSSSISRLFLMCLLSRFTYLVSRKSFLKKEHFVSSILKGFPVFPLLLSDTAPEISKIVCFFPLSSETDSEFSLATFIFHCSYWFGSCNSHSCPYHHILLLFYFSTDIPCFSTSAGLCFVLMYRNATSECFIDDLSDSVLYKKRCAVSVLEICPESVSILYSHVFSCKAKAPCTH